MNHSQTNLKPGASLNYETGFLLFETGVSHYETGKGKSHDFETASPSYETGSQHFETYCTNKERDGMKSVLGQKFVGQLS